MSSYEEKLSILSEMIAFAKVDDLVKDSEYQFLLNVANQLAVPRNIFDKLVDNESKHLTPKTEAERILQFHRIVLLMNVDQVQEEEEVRKLHNIGLGLGLPPAAIGSGSLVMHRYPNKVVPPNVLIDIFKAHYN